jgi:uncharacterized protein
MFRHRAGRTSATHVSPRPPTSVAAGPPSGEHTVPGRRTCSGRGQEDQREDRGVNSLEGESRFLGAVLQNPRVRDVLERAERLDLPDWYLAAGCLFQTVWNVLDERDPEHGIQDYDLIYFDDTDRSWDAEDVVIRRCADAFDDLGVEVEVRNQARVHLWYEDHFGVPYPPLRSSAEAVDRYAAHACRVAVRSSGGRFEVYAPSGYDDLFAFIVRPNPVVAPRHVYETKASRWAALWPRLQVLPWPNPTEPQNWRQ